MNSPSPVDIKVIYSASSRPKRKRGKVVTVARRPGTPSWIVLGALNLAVAGGLSYATWWQVDPFLNTTLMWTTPLPGVDANEAAGAILPALATNAEPDSPPPAEDKPLERAAFVGSTARTIIISAAYSWLTLATIAAWALALSAGAALGRAGGPMLRGAGAILALGGAALIGWVTYEVLSEYNWGYPMDFLRGGMLALAGLSALVGLAIGRGVRGLTRLAAVTLILSAVGTVLGLFLGGKCDAIAAERCTPAFLALVFVAHSLYGWILLPVSFRVRR